jgi:chromosome segregation ATPase
MDDFPDLHHKMSKKIAQLTKVIFHLNTKNDEYEYNLRAVVQAYENEMDNIVKEANASINRYKESLVEAQKNKEAEKQLRQLQEKVEAEKQKAIIEFNTYKKQCEDREAKLNRDTSGKLEIYKQEVENLRVKYEAMQKNVEKITLAIEDNKSSHRKEMSDYVREQNEKYNELLKKKLDLEDLLRERDATIAKLKKDLDDLNKKLMEDLKNNKGATEKIITDMVSVIALNLKSFL